MDSPFLDLGAFQSPLALGLDTNAADLLLGESSKMVVNNVTADERNMTKGGGFAISDLEIDEFLDALNRYNNLTRNAQAEVCSRHNPEKIDIYSVAESYKQLHGYFALIVCTFGVISNCLIMIVLRRKEMRTPVNLMLFALAIADLLIMLEYIPFALHRYLIKLEDPFSWGFAVFIFFHVHFTQIIHTISIQLTLTMAIWRYVAIKCSNRSSTFCTFKRCYQVIAAAYICPLFFCILNYLYFQINERTKFITHGPPPFDNIDGNDKEKLEIFQKTCKIFNHCDMKEVHLYVVESSDLVTQKYPILHKVHFWTFSVLIKLIPCVVLTFFMCWLVNTLYKARRHHKMLENKAAMPLNPMQNVENGECQSQHSPSKGTGGRMIHTEVQAHNKKVGNGISPSKSIRFAPDTDQDKASTAPQEENESPKAALLQTNGMNGTRIVGCGNVNPPVETLIMTTTTPPGESRRASRASDGSSSVSGAGVDGPSHSGRRFTKNLIHFPSLRRQSSDKGPKSSKACKRTDRTSKMLIAVLLLFLLTEFPQGIMHFLTGWYGPEFLRCQYNPWAEIWDILALINSSINFILYCFMSKQFRTQFQISFNHPVCFKKKWITLSSACKNNQTVSTTV